MRIRPRYFLHNLKLLPARMLFTLQAIPAGLRGELTVAKATLSLKHFGPDGALIRDYGIVSRKKVTKAFVIDIAAALAGTAGPYASFNDYKFHDSGVGVTGEDNANTLIETTDGESRVTGTQVDASTADAGIYTSVGTITYSAPRVITEHGLFNVVTDATPTLMDRSVFAAVNVGIGDSIQFTYTLTINPET
jgi:hypothetical protein